MTTLLEFVLLLVMYSVVSLYYVVKPVRAFLRKDESGFVITLAEAKKAMEATVTRALMMLLLGVVLIIISFVCGVSWLSKEDGGITPLTALQIAIPIAVGLFVAYLSINRWIYKRRRS